MQELHVFTCVLGELPIIYTSMSQIDVYSMILFLEKSFSYIAEYHYYLPI